MIHPLAWRPAPAAVRPAVTLRAPACKRCPGHAGVPAGARRAPGDLAEAFRACGEVLEADELAGRLRSVHDQPVSWLARLIVSRAVLSLRSQGGILVPMFQFAADDLTLHRPVAVVFRELSEVYDEEELARWFVQPNDWLAGVSPLAALDGDADAVVAAARADRFVARG